METFDKFVMWGFMGMTAGSLAFAVSFLQKISKSINRLNVQVATIIERTTTHGKQIDNHELRISAFERKHGR